MNSRIIRRSKNLYLDTEVDLSVSDIFYFTFSTIQNTKNVIGSSKLNRSFVTTDGHRNSPGRTNLHQRCTCVSYCYNMICYIPPFRILRGSSDQRIQTSYHIAGGFFTNQPPRAKMGGQPIFSRGSSQPGINQVSALQTDSSQLSYFTVLGRGSYKNGHLLVFADPYLKKTH